MHLPWLPWRTPRSPYPNHSGQQLSLPSPELPSSVPASLCCPSAPALQQCPCFQQPLSTPSALLNILESLGHPRDFPFTTPQSCALAVSISLITAGDKPHTRSFLFHSTCLGFSFSCIHYITQTSSSSRLREVLGISARSRSEIHEGRPSICAPHPIS